MDSVKTYYQKEIERKRDFYKKARNIEPLQHLLVSKFILELPPGKACLDIGCNVGTTLSFIREHFDELYGIDIVDTPEIRRKTYIHFICTDINSEPLPFEENKFNVIICSMIFEHIFDPFRLMREIRRCLKKGGYLIFGVPNACYFKHIFSLFLGRVPRTAMRVDNFSEDESWDGQHLHLYSIKDIKDLFNKFGFMIKKIGSAGRFLMLRKICPDLFFSDLYILGQKIG